MAKKIKVKLILQLRAARHSRNSIASSQGMAKLSVMSVFDRADELGICFDDVADKDEDEVYRLIFPERHQQEVIFEQPDWNYIHKELGRVGVTLVILHAEYVDECKRKGAVFMSYTTFCRGYDSYVASKDVTSHIERKAGRSIEVDWSGPTMRIVDPSSGEITKVYLFVGCLPYSRYVYVEPTLDMKQNTWLLCHVHMFEYFGGSTPRLIPDNLKTGVIKHPKEGEVVLNEAYREMAAHYSAAVLPARSLHPKDKPNAEGAVGNIARDIIAPLRNTTFTSFAALKLAIDEKLKEHNDKPFQKRPGNRKACFEDEEKETLQPLPAVPYEICEWIYKRKVKQNCHVAYKKNFYSCSWRYVGQTVDLRITDTTVEIYKGTERIATHALLPPWVANKYSTRDSDIPESKVYREWDTERIRNWADRIGPATTACINRIFESVKFDEQGFDACLAILRLSKKYSSQRVEAACSIALSSGINSPRYKHVKLILETSQDKTSKQREPDVEVGGYVRGADYYSKGE